MASSNNAVTATSGGVPTASALATGAPTVPVLVAYYFHGTQKCRTCLRMEQYARDAIEGMYQAEVGSGQVRWLAVNYDEPPKGHFVKEYGLVASSLVIVSQQSAAPGTWRKLDRIWDLIGDESASKSYMVEEVKNLLRSDS